MTATADKKPPRLRFIDMARAVAILLMLEGHFVHLTLADEYRIAGNGIYEVWLHARGLAAPMFYCVTGLIFSYLLSGAPVDQPYFQTRRVRRGLVRIVELMFWGYALQFHPALLTGQMKLHAHSWFFAFHVLQCIACGLIMMIVIFGLLRRFGAKALIPAFLLSGFSLFLLEQVLINHDGYWPANAPAILQNFVKGPTSHFSIAPWLGFTLYGAAMGTWIRHHQQTKGGIIHPAPFFIIGSILSYYGWRIDNRIAHAFLDLLGYDRVTRTTSFFFHARFAETLLLIGFLVCVDKWARVRTGWLETIGRNTFPIYIVHAIVLYGGIFGIGINNIWTKALNPWQAASGALVFMIVFAFLAQLADPIEKRCQSLWQRLRHGKA